MALIDAGERLPLTGGYEWVTPMGTLRSPNITPDAETGIGRYTDGQLARMLRHNVRPDGRGTLPFMEFNNMSDEDVVAVISFLRAQEGIHRRVPDHEPNLLGRAIMTFQAHPRPPAGTPPARSPDAEPSIDRGAYLANAVASCAGCHTERNMLDGSYIGPRFAGGAVMELDDDPNRFFVTPNLTPDPQTGHIAQWSEDAFVARFRVGKVIKESHMPWGSFALMSDTDLRAIYRYLMSLEPVENQTGPLLQTKKS